MRCFSKPSEQPVRRRTWRWWNVGCSLALILGGARPVFAQQGEPSPVDAQASHDLQRRVEQLETEVAELKRLIQGKNSANQPLEAPPSAGRVVATSTVPAVSLSLTEGNQQQPGATPRASFGGEDRKTLAFLRDTTINLGLDGYYAYNFNSPVGRVNLLRAYDVLSNNISLNQASVIFERAPGVSHGRRFGARLDLQFGQATDTLQGNPANEPRPQIYRNIFQAYGTYIAPIGNGLTLDVGKWSSSLGVENNYTKDQMNYSRSYYFDFLPFYHMGIRANYQLNDRLALSYWLVNGTNQAEATNGFKDELFGFVAKPRTSITWTVNYYLGQEHPDRIVVSPVSPIPVQPGLSFQAIRPAPDGRLHIFDSYVMWQVSPRWTVVLEGDYVIERLWRNEAPGRSSAPSHVAGGAVYARYQFTPRLGVAGRAEYLSDRGGLFSGLTQALKETTATFDYKVGDGFLMRYEWRRDFSNQPTFLTNSQGVLSKKQNTASVGLVWWWGRKEGAW
jgi:hypothetical protein